jgi:hypothetical protein
MLEIAVQEPDELWPAPYIRAYNPHSTAGRSCGLCAKQLFHAGGFSHYTRDTRSSFMLVASATAPETHAAHSCWRLQPLHPRHGHILVMGFADLTLYVCSTIRSRFVGFQDVFYLLLSRENGTIVHLPLRPSRREARDKAIVDALCYNPEGSRFDSQWGHWIFK